VADVSLSGRRVARELDLLIVTRGRPRTIVSDNGSECGSRDERPRQNGSFDSPDFADARQPGVG
jgi:hypothetical protein